MKLKSQDVTFTLQILDWLKSKKEWLREGGEEICLSEKMMLIESWFTSKEDYEIFSVHKKDDILIGFVKIDSVYFENNVKKIFLHIYIKESKRNKGYGYHALKQSIKFLKERGETKIYTIVKPDSKTYKLLKDSQLMKPTREKKICGYSVFKAVL